MMFRVLFVAAFTFALAGCCGNKEKASPDSSSVAHAPAAAPAVRAGIGTGVVNAPRTATNQTGRGIVRAAPNFQAPEVIRLNPGTQVTITSKAPAAGTPSRGPRGMASSTAT